MNKKEISTIPQASAAVEEAPTNKDKHAIVFDLPPPEFTDEEIQAAFKFIDLNRLANSSFTRLSNNHGLFLAMDSSARLRFGTSWCAWVS